jgi:glycosyltransferase involved in cell wall biosynthesis
MKYFLVDKNLIDPVNYHKWTLFAQKKDVELRALVPDRWIENSRMLHFDESFQTNFPTTAKHVFWPGFENRGFYVEGLVEEFKKADPDVFICFEEPCSLFALQSLLTLKMHKPSCKFVFFSWYNRYPDKFYAYRPQFFYRTILWNTLRHADLVLCANEEARVFYNSRVGDRAKKMYFGVNLDQFMVDDSERTPYTGDRPLRIGYVGRLLEMKSIDTLFDAVASLRQKAPVELFLLGNGDYKSELQRYAKEVGIADITEFSQAVPSTEVANYMRNMDVMVLPSKTTRFWKEQYGRVLIEAMAAGVPLVGSSSGAIPEVIGDAGLIFEEQNAVDLEQKLQMVIDKPELLQQFSAKGKERSHQFSSEVFADTIHKYILELFD